MDLLNRKVLLVWRKIKGRVITFRLKKSNLRWGLIISTFIFLVITTLISVHVITKKSKVNAYSNLLRINSVQQELRSLRGQLSSVTSTNNHGKQDIEAKLQALNERLVAISKQDGLSTTTDIKKLKSDIQSTNTSMYQKINAMNNEIKSLKRQVEPATTLNPNTLPFIVQNIDVWNGRPYAEIAQKANQTMVSYLGLYQRSGLWKVVEINAPDQTVAFINADHQLVRVQVKSF